MCWARISVALGYPEFLKFFKHVLALLHRTGSNQLHRVGLLPNPQQFRETYPHVPLVELSNAQEMRHMDQIPSMFSNFWACSAVKPAFKVRPALFNHSSSTSIPICTSGSGIVRSSTSGFGNENPYKVNSRKFSAGMCGISF